MEKVMVLGAGRGQVPIINVLKNYGYYVIAVSTKGNYPGFEVADEAAYIDIREKDIVLEYAIKKDIKGVLTDQLDEGVATAAYVSEKLNLRGITCEVAEKFTNKYVMRKEAAKAGISVPNSIKVSNIEEAIEKINSKGMKFPMMLKPLDSSASRGVYKIYGIDDLNNYFLESMNYSKYGEVIVEEYIFGKEYVVEAYTSSYEVNNLVVGHRDYFNIKDTFIPSATVFSDALSADTELEERLKSTNKKLIESFGLEFGITHAEYLYNEERDEIFLVEIAARGGGVFISSELIPLASGVNAIELVVKDTMGIEDNKSISLRNGAAAYFCYLVPKGKVLSIDGVDKIKKISGIHNAYFDNIYEGMETNAIIDKSSRKGPILVVAKDKKQCYEVIDKVKKELLIKVDTLDGVKDIVWE